MKRLQVTSLLDAPCGDAGWIARADLAVRLTGIDIVPDLIETLRARAGRGEIAGGDYHLADVTTDPLPRCEAVLCRELLHASLPISRARSKIFAVPVRAISSPRPFLTGRSTAIARTVTGAHTEFRTRTVFLGPAGRGLINENCTEAGGGWRD